MVLTGVMRESGAGQSVNWPSSVIKFPTFTGTSVEGSVMMYCGGLLKSPGRAAAPLSIRATKLIEWGAGPLGGVNSVCGIASSTLSPLLETPQLSGAPPLSWVATPVDVTEYR